MREGYLPATAEVGQLTAQCDASPSVSEHTAQRTLLDVELHTRRPTHGPLRTMPATPTVGSEIGVPSSTVELLIPPYTRTGDGAIMLWRTFSWVTLVPFSSSRKDCESNRLSEHNCGSVTPLYDVCFPS
ncbi:hypothetical protein TNCV_957871 [Trichonephila clavipes]|nr:hypothetical protein TNCV_957871 [Trichonephila clavipes]